MTEPTTTAAIVKQPPPPAYTLLSSIETVQVLSPTVVNPVLYCTLSTIPSNIIASYPIPIGTFESELTAPVLTNFSIAIENVLKLPSVVAAVGTQTIDQSGLLQDNVTFTVQYVQSGTTGTSVTADAVVPVSVLNAENVSHGAPVNADVLAIINETLSGLQNAAGQ